MIFGGMLMVSGTLGAAAAILSFGVLAMNTGLASFSQALSWYGLMPVFVAFIIIGVAGFLLGIWGVIEKDK
ncbi:MAG: hypothetical protein FWF18_02100 [Dehalococcoidia bacterium]|nr:hypothetical protein [Dehalococcoidia bacterium]